MGAIAPDSICPWSITRWASGGFPGGAVVENLPANAGDTGLSPGLGRSHMPRSNWAREPQLLSLRVWSLCSATREATLVRGPCTAMKSGPRLPQLEKALAQKRRPNIAINQSINQSIKKKKDFISSSSPLKKKKDGLLVTCVYRIYYFNYFNSNNLHNMDTKFKNMPMKKP